MPTKAKKPAAPGFRTRFRSFFSSVRHSVARHKVLTVVLVLAIFFIGRWLIGVGVEKANFRRSEETITRIEKRLNFKQPVTKSCAKQLGSYQQGRAYCEVKIVENIKGSNDEIENKLRNILKIVNEELSLQKQTNNIRLDSAFGGNSNDLYRLKDTNIQCSAGYQEKESMTNSYDFILACSSPVHFILY